MALLVKKPKAGDWDFDGSCRPGSGLMSCNTFSVGIFQWVAKSNKNGIKRSAVVKRIRGFTSNPQKVYSEAKNYINEHLKFQSTRPRKARHV